MKYTKMIFDLDGTLLDSMYIWDHFVEELLMKYQCSVLSDLHEEIEKMTLKEAAHKLATYIPLPTEVVLQEIQTLLEEKYAHVSWKPGVKHAISTFYQQGVQLYIATANDENLTSKVISRLGMETYFQKIVSCDMIGRRKQEPDFYHQLAQMLKVDTQHCLLIEDALHAIEAAKQAGYSTVGVYDESANKNWEAIRKTADYSFRTMQEMEEWICTKQ